MPMPRNSSGDPILATEWNLLADQIDENTDDIVTLNTTLKARPDNVDLGSLGATETITASAATAQVFTGVIDANLTLTVAGFSSGTFAQPIQLILNYDGVSQKTISFVGVDWWDGFVPAQGPANANQRIVLTFTDLGDGDVVGAYLLLTAAP